MAQISFLQFKDPRRPDTLPVMIKISTCIPNITYVITKNIDSFEITKVWHPYALGFSLQSIDIQMKFPKETSR